MTVRQKQSVGAFLFASLLATSVIAIQPIQWSPICAAFEEGSLEWLVFGCWSNPPPKDPSA